MIDPSSRPAFSTASRQVSWWTVHQFIHPLLEAVGSWPMAGTPAWVDAEAAVKSASLFDAAQHWALRVETAQAAQAEASREVSTAVDWPAIANEMRRRSGIYIPRRSA